MSASRTCHQETRKADFGAGESAEAATVKDPHPRTRREIQPSSPVNDPLKHLVVQDGLAPGSRFQWIENFKVGVDPGTEAANG